MSYKFGGWFLNKKIYAKIKFSNELWYFSSSDARCTHLFMMGWYTLTEFKVKLFTINFLFLSIQVGFMPKNP